MTSKSNQSGFALLLFVVTIIGFVMAGFAGLLTSSVKDKNEKSRIKNIQVLKQAKEALLSYAVNYAVSGDLNDMGKLPCPDSNAAGTEGNQDANCGASGVNSAGYFPFKSLGLGKIEDSTNECLWYVVSGDYKNWVEADLLNWDSIGYLNLVDENDNLKHGANEEDYPVAFIISPGASINQNRATANELPACKANFVLANYLEGGPNIDYAADLPLTANTLWEFLTTSNASSLNDADYNDHVIAIYKNELWNRVQQMNDLVINNAPATAPASRIEMLTQSLAECLVAYGNDAANVNRVLPYPAPLDLDPTDTDPDEYYENTNYNDDAAIHYGRFPQVLDDSVWPTANFVLDTAGISYCENVAGTAYDELFWKNWKDHFFYLVSEDFNSGSVVPADNTKCTVNGCITVNGNVDKVAAMVLFAGSATAAQNRVWWWDDATATATIDNKSAVVNYLEGGNETVYAGGVQNYNSLANDNDYAFCIEYDNTAFTFSEIKCTDLDNTL